MQGVDSNEEEKFLLVGLLDTEEFFAPIKRSARLRVYIVYCLRVCFYGELPWTCPQFCQLQTIAEKNGDG